MRRFVAAGAAKTEVGGQDVIAAQIVPILEAVAPYRECHLINP
jgi:hypothetical protein